MNTCAYNAIDLDWPTPIPFRLLNTTVVSKVSGSPSSQVSGGATADASAEKCSRCAVVHSQQLHAQHTLLQGLGRLDLLRVILQFLEPSSQRKLVPQLTSRDSASGGVSETGAVFLEDHRTGILFLGQLQVPGYRVLTCKLALADDTEVSLLDMVALEMAVAVVDSRKRLVALVAGVRAKSLVGHAVGLKVELSRESAAATGFFTDEFVDGRLVGAFGLEIAFLAIVGSFVGDVFKTCSWERGRLNSRECGRR